MTTTLPIDLIGEILLWLPVKPLLRCKSVSKPWYDLIKTPAFVRLYSARSTYIVFPGCNHDLTEVDNTSKLLCINLVHCYGSCNGYTLCILEGDKHRFYLQSKKRLVLYSFVDGSNIEIPYDDPRTGFRENGIEYSPYQEKWFGFGYDSKSHDFKVVLIIRTKISYVVPSHSEVIFDETEVKVYSLRANSWRTVVEKLPFRLRSPLQEYEGNNFLNNALHWLVKQKRNNIACFDLFKERFYEMSSPGLDVGRYGYQVLAVLGERMHLISYDNKVYNSLDVWVMKEYGVEDSWAKLCHVENSGGPLRAVGYWKEGREILFQRLQSEKPLSINWKDETRNEDIKLSDPLPHTKCLMFHDLRQ